MLERANAMQRLNHSIEEKNSRICAILDIDAKRLNSEEITYEYWAAYLQSIADIVPAVKINMDERKKLYWDIVELAKVLGFFVIGEIKEEEIGYIMENKTKAIVENHTIDAIVIDVDIHKELAEIEQFLKCLKANGKGAFISIRDHEEEEAKRWQIIKRIKKRKRISSREKFFEIQHKIDRSCYAEDGKPDYLMVGIAILRSEHIPIMNTDTFSLIYNYEEEKNNDIVTIFDGNGLGALITINFTKDCSATCYSEENWGEIRSKVIEKRDEINSAINEYYGIE